MRTARATLLDGARRIEPKTCNSARLFGTIVERRFRSAISIVLGGKSASPVLVRYCRPIAHEADRRARKKAEVMRPACLGDGVYWNVPGFQTLRTQIGSRRNAAHGGKLRPRPCSFCIADRNLIAVRDGRADRCNRRAAIVLCSASVPGRKRRDVFRYSGSGDNIDGWRTHTPRRKRAKNG